MDCEKNYEIKKILIAELTGLQVNHYKNSMLYQEAAQVLCDVKRIDSGVGEILCKYEDFWMESRIPVADLMKMN